MLTYINAFMRIGTTPGSVNMNRYERKPGSHYHQRKIQSALLNGNCLTEDEIALIRQCASELLEKIPAPSKTWTSLAQPVDEGPQGKVMGTNRREPALSAL